VDWSAPGLGINRGCAFSEGLAAILVNGEFGYIDRSGKMVIVPQFDRASRFSGGLAEVQVVDARGYARGYIDKQGRYIWAPSR
jgi:predicted NUDIX family NTP pyrophosphohydrolase